MNKRLLDQMTLNKNPTHRNSTSGAVCYGWYGWTNDPYELCSVDDLCFFLWDRLDDFSDEIGYWKLYPSLEAAEAALASVVRSLR